MTRSNGVPAFAARKRRLGAEPIAMLTAYDAPFGAIAAAAGVDLILVGDSVGDNVLGFKNTLGVTLDDVAHHTGAVARGAGDTLVVADMPWMTYHTTVADAVEHAAVLVRAGAGAVKLEGGAKRAPVVRAIVDAEIPVMGHLGLTPQSIHAMGGLHVQARDAVAAARLRSDARALEAAGCFAVVLEGIPRSLAADVTAELTIPTIGIGAGPDCDGQVLVLHDVLGLGARTPPKFVRAYADLATAATRAIESYVEDVRSGSFPSDAESYH